MRSRKVRVLNGFSVAETAVNLRDFGSRAVREVDTGNAGVDTISFTVETPRRQDLPIFEG